MTELERLLKAKIPCEETGIEVKHGICDICAPGMHCGIDAYVKDGKIIKIEGDMTHPVSHGLLCPKGQSNRAYIYRKDRVLTPLKRVGKRGDGKFESISWDEALNTLCDKFTQFKNENGAESCVFFSGYNKWYRPILQRLASSFGSPNYGTESSCCFTSGLMAWETATGMPARSDQAHSDLFLGWGMNGYYSKYLMPKGIMNCKSRGMKVIIIDPRITPAVEKLADLHLQLKLGTDGALALGIANILIKNGWIDKEYIEKYVHGFEEYSDYVSKFDENEVVRITGVPYEKVLKAAEMIHESKRISAMESSAPLAHHINGYQNYRAVMSLLAITGNYDREGGQIPAPHSYTHVGAGFETQEHKFIRENIPTDVPTVGAEKFPLWYELEKEMQSNDLARQILEGKPYPIRGIFALGMNMRMFSDSNLVKSALEEVEFFVDSELFLTDTAKYADIILPVCSSLEREEFKCYSGGYAGYTQQVIKPLGEARSDVDVLCEIARRLHVGDEVLEGGYDSCVSYMISNLSVTVEEMKANRGFRRVPEFKPYEYGSNIERGLPTKTGKFELKSELIAAHPEWGLDALPTFTEPCDMKEKEEYPFVLCAGARKSNMMHSRLHDVKWLRSLSPNPTVEINMEDAKMLGIKNGDEVLISTERAEISAQASITMTVLQGEVFMYHGYREADTNSLMRYDKLDPYSGFPAYRSVCCCIRKGK